MYTTLEIGYLYFKYNSLFVLNIMKVNVLVYTNDNSELNKRRKSFICTKSSLNKMKLWDRALRSYFPSGSRITTMTKQTVLLRICCFLWGLNIYLYLELLNTTPPYKHFIWPLDEHAVT